MQVQEDLDLRLKRIPNYVKTFTGHAPTQSELDRFHAQVSTV
jgi:hypothetical protein